MAQFWIDVADLTDLSDFTVVSGIGPELTTHNGFPVIALSSFGELFYLNAAGSVADADVMLLTALSSTRAGGWRVQGAGLRIADDDNYYYFGDGGSDSIRLRSVIAGSSGSFASASALFDQFEWHWLALKAEGSALSAYTWLGGAGDRPATPTMSASDSALSSGYVGVGCTAAAAPTQRIRIISIGTNGDPAPTGPLGAGAPVLSSPSASLITATSITPNVTLTF